LSAALLINTEQPVRLLLAEDEPTQRLLLKRRLTRAGYLVETAKDGDEALARIVRGQTQILVTDWDMPGMDGVTLCRRVREARLTGYVYILLLTGHGAVADVVAGLEAGADDYLEKPADEAELLARLKAGRRIVDLERSLRDAHAQVRLMSVTDPLLGIFNRRYLMEELPQEVGRARRHGRPLSLIMADLDHFKRVNDGHGHDVGDELLVSFTRLLRASIRAGDWIARAGGEEFVIVLPETDSAGATVLAENIRAACAAMRLPAATGVLGVTTSLGIASLQSTQDLPQAAAALMRQADQALYRSKRAGRNRVSTACA
jgi:two-component system cell cycle response regulator